MKKEKEAKPGDMVIVQQGEIMPVETNFERFIKLAITEKTPVETLERLLAMQEKVEAMNAKRAYDEALSAFQKVCPIISKSKAVYNKDGKSVRYRFAPMDSIISQVRDPLAAHGFSYEADTELSPDGKMITAIVTAMHAAGHSRTKRFQVPIDKDAFMNEQQKVAAARTYALRYCFLGIFGIMTGDEDDDATSIEPQKTEQHKTEPQKQTPPPQTHTDKKEATAGENGREQGFVTDVVTGPSGKRWKLVINGKGFYTFNQKLVEDAKLGALEKEIVVYWKKSKFGMDIERYTYDLAKDLAELSEKPSAGE